MCQSLNDFVTFVQENNPTILDYGYCPPDEDFLNDSTDKDGSTNKDDNTNQKTEDQKEIPYESKYLTKFKTFPNEYRFSDLENEQEISKFTELMNMCKQKISKEISSAENLIKLIKVTESKRDIDECMAILEYEEPEDEEMSKETVSELWDALYGLKVETAQRLVELEKPINIAAITEEAYQWKVNQHLDKLIDCYVLDYTPLGNVYMRYNNSKKTFEYWSNSTIPYRYLEPVGRKYVMTYWCKPLYVDLEEELKKAESKYEQEKAEKEEKVKVEKLGKKPENQIMAKFKSYNKEVSSSSSMKPNMVPKNRSSQMSLPASVTANLPNVNTTSEKQLLKEQANRYTCEGRLHDFKVLKPIERKVFDKKLTMSWAEFKKMQSAQKK
jgi:hypothetical protein